MSYLTKYSVRPTRLKHATKSGLILTDNNELILDEHEDMHYLFLPVFDSGITDGKWGRFAFELENAEDVSIKVITFATNETYFYRKGVLTKIDKFLCDDGIPSVVKLEFLKAAQAKETVGHSDFLMYDLEGRYLYTAIVFEGESKGEVKNIRIVNPGDTFMNLFPEVYREWGGFFHRYLSVMSSLFNDLQEKVEDFADNLDVEKACPELLEVFASWMGIDVSGSFLEEEVLRSIVREGPELNRLKGTKKALERLARIMLGEDAIVVEKRSAKDSKSYGNSIYDVTILVKNFVEESKKAQLFYMLRQFVPIRSRLQIIYLADKSELDEYTFLDINAKIFNTNQGTLDEHMTLDSNIVLLE